MRSGGPSRIQKNASWRTPKRPRPHLISRSRIPLPLQSRLHPLPNSRWKRKQTWHWSRYRKQNRHRCHNLQRKRRKLFNWTWQPRRGLRACDRRPMPVFWISNCQQKIHLCRRSWYQHLWRRARHPVPMAATTGRRGRTQVPIGGRWSPIRFRPKGLHPVRRPAVLARSGRRHAG